MCQQEPQWLLKQRLFCSCGWQICNLVPTVFSAFNMAKGLEKILAHSRSRDQICPSRMDKYAIFFKMAERNKVREIWVRQLPTNKMEYEGGTQSCKIWCKKPKIRMDEGTSNENAVDDREILLFSSFHVILNKCNFMDGYYFSGLWFLNGWPENTDPRSMDPSTDWVHGLPHGPVHGLPLRTPYTDHPKTT